MIVCFYVKAPILGAKDSSHANDITVTTNLMKKPYILGPPVAVVVKEVSIGAEG